MKLRRFVLRKILLTPSSSLYSSFKENRAFVSTFYIELKLNELTLKLFLH